MYNLFGKCIQNDLRAKTETSPRFQKYFCRRVIFDIAILRICLFLKFTKMTFSCSRITYKCRTMLQVIPNVCLDSEKLFLCTQCVSKFIQNDFRAKKETSSRSQRLFVGISCPLLHSMVLLKSTKMSLSYHKITCMCHTML